MVVYFHGPTCRVSNKWTTISGWVVTDWALFTLWNRNTEKEIRLLPFLQATILTLTPTSLDHWRSWEIGHSTDLSNGHTCAFCGARKQLFTLPAERWWGCGNVRSASPYSKSTASLSSTSLFACPHVSSVGSDISFVRSHSTVGRLFAHVCASSA